MSKIAFPRMEVLRMLDELTADITPNRFITTRPNAVGNGMQEFLLISLSNIEDSADTYQHTRGRISIFARDVQGTGAGGDAVSGMENTLRLDEMLNAVTGLFPMVTELFHGKRPQLLAGGSDDAGFHYLTIQFNITILK